MSLYLLVIAVHNFLLLEAVVLLVLEGLLLDLLLELSKLFVVIFLFLSSLTLQLLMFSYLLVAHYLLFDDLLSDGVFLLLLFSCKVVLRLSDLLIVLKVGLFLLLLGGFVVLHLPQKLLLDTRLVLSESLLDCILLLLELIYVVHDNLGPIVILLLG